MRKFGRNRPRHAVEASWRQHGRRVSRRALLILAVALIGGPLTYIVLPAPVAAQPAALTVLQAAPASSAPVTPAALVGGLIESGDLVSDPVGVVSSGTRLVADGDLIGWPVSDHTPSTGFGYRSDPFTHRQRWHDGVDLGQACGDPAWASLDGTVVHAGWAGGYGNRVILRHADRSGLSFATTYNHLARIEVEVGQQVTKGQVVGRIGSTGRSTACHLHFEVILDGSYVDPMRFLTGDASKAGLSRRVGSAMPVGMPSPDPTRSRTATPTPSATHSASRTPTPSPTTPSGSGTPTPGPTTPTTRSTTPTPTPSPTAPSPTAPTPIPLSPPAPTGTPSATAAITPGSAPAQGSVAAGSPTPTATGSAAASPS
ncbi:MAG: peptidoglycan DD-metalloendopeptidase family protein [Propionicimonas sp.]